MNTNLSQVKLIRDINLKAVGGSTLRQNFLSRSVKFQVRDNCLYFSIIRAVGKYPFAEAT